MPTLIADLVLLDANFKTMNQSHPFAEAVAIKKDKIVKVGTNEEITPLIGIDTRVVCLEGKTVLPGFIDTHIHVADFGRFLVWLDLKDVKSISELQNSLRVRTQKTLEGKWIVGRGWNHACFEEKRLPTLLDLDSSSPNNPVILYHESAMMCVVNSRALDLAGITMLTPAPSGGEIDRDINTGQPTGILRGNATDLVWKIVPEPSENELLEAVECASEKISEAGITSIHWIVLSDSEISIVKTMRAKEKFHFRIYLIIPANLLGSIANLGIDDLAFRVGGALVFVDGYLATKTSALYQPFVGETNPNNKLLCSQRELKDLSSRLLSMGLQPVFHATGDKAVEEALSAIDQLEKEPAVKNIRFRIEQAAVLNKRLISRIKNGKVVVSVQPCVIASEFSVWSVAEKLGQRRARWVYPLATLLEEDVPVVGGSDCPMEPLCPLLGIQAAVLREFPTEERITVDQALRMYTTDAAYSSDEERVKGSIEEGKLADLTVLSLDPTEVAPEKIGAIEVEMTITGGKIVFSKL